MKTIVVTGGSAGIGLAIADRFAREGWQVAILARDEARLADAGAGLRAHDAPAMATSADVADPDAVSSAADRIERKFGPIEIRVNNAMSTVVARAPEITPNECARVTATTYLSQVYGTLAALRYMRERNRGTIMQISSGLAIRAAPMEAAYCGAKAAVGGFTDSLRTGPIADRSEVTLSVVSLPSVNTHNLPGRATAAATNRSYQAQSIRDCARMRSGQRPTIRIARSGSAGRRR